MRKHLLKSALCLCLVVVLASTLALSASATVTETSETSATVHTYTATYENPSITSSGFYLLIALKASAVTKNADDTYSINSDGFKADNIMYIDQATGDDENKVTFGTNEKPWVPKSFAGGQVFIIGTGLSATWIGSLTAYGIELNGAVSFLEGAKTQPDVTLTPKAEGTTPTVNIVDADLTEGTAGVAGSSIPDGEYTLTITKKGYLPYTVTITVSGDDITLPEGLELLAGDANGDGLYINFDDLSEIITNYKKDGFSGTSKDVNEDGWVNFDDLSIILTNYKKDYAN